MVMTVHFPFQNTYSALPSNFFARVAPTPVAAPRLIKLNRPLAIHLGLDPDRLDSPEGAEILAIHELQSLKPIEVWRHTKKYPSVYSLLLRTVFQSHDRTLRDDELTQWSTQIIETLTSLGGTLRA